MKFDMKKILSIVSKQIFPSLDCSKANKSLKKKAESNESQSNISFKGNVDKIPIESFRKKYSDTFETKDKFEDKDEIKAYLTKILEGQAFDQKGLIYGMGHAVYSLSDPRERIFKGFVEQLSAAKHRERDMTLYNNIEELAPEIIAQKRKIYKGVSPNVDFYSGFVYDMLGIPVELYTPIFAVARIVGWSAHRLEEIVGNGKIIRPSYKSVMEEL